MAIINTVRPVSTSFAGGWTASAGTLHSATSDNSDATYAASGASNTTSMYLDCSNHTVPANHERHGIRGRSRMYSSGGGASVILSGVAVVGILGEAQVWTVPSVVQEYTGLWARDGDGGTLPAGGTLTGIRTWNRRYSGGNVRATELYVDIDCRHHPVFDPRLTAEQEDVTNGVSPSGQIRITADNLDLDGLDLNGWSVVIKEGVTTVFSHAGTGILSFGVTLPNGNYTVEMTYSANIRESDTYSHTESVTVIVDIPVPPPSSPTGITATPTSFGTLLEWSDPGDTDYDGDVAVEVQRSVCGAPFETVNIIPSELTGSYLDVTTPTGDTGCDYDPCTVSYRLRYWGYVSTVVTPPETVPEGFIVGWPDTAGSIPDGWSRVTSMDGRHPRGSATNNPTGTGGSTTHEHTTRPHDHTIEGHTHPGSPTGTSSAATTMNRNVPAGGSRDFRSAAHSHTVPSSLGPALRYLGSGSATSVLPRSGSASPGTNEVPNDPPSQEVIWIASDGTPVEIPEGSLVYGQSRPEGYDLVSSGVRYLKGAASAGNGGSVVGSLTHSHTVDSHTHSGVTHTHGVVVSSAGMGNYSSTVSSNLNNRYWYGGSSVLTYPVFGSHRHFVTTNNASSGTLVSTGGGTTGSSEIDPIHRRLNILESPGGPIVTGIIGLFKGDISTLPADLTRCDGTSGTPNMIGNFAKNAENSSVGGTGGSSTHSHTTPSSHTHATPGHTHSRTVVSLASSMTVGQDTSPVTNTVLARNHNHTIAASASEAPNSTASQSGSIDSVEATPLYGDVHFVRLDGTGSDPLDVPVLIASEWSGVEAAIIEDNPGMDRLVTLSGQGVLLCADVAYSRPSKSTVDPPITGGLPTVSVARSGKTVNLTITTRGMQAVKDLEAVLSAELLYFSPWGGEPEWLVPGPWSVTSPMAKIKVFTVSLVRQDGPPVLEPEDIL